MAKYVNVESGDYTITVSDGGTIKLDTGKSGGNPGKVIVTGNLEIQGAATTVYTNDLIIDDNIIQLNRVVTTDGSNGVRTLSDITSGLSVDLGYTDIGTGNFVNLPQAQWIYDGSIIFKNPQNPNDPFNRGCWVPKLDDGELLGIQAVSITAPQDSDLNLLGVVADGAGGTVPHTGFVTVEGATGYSTRIGDLPLDKIVDPGTETVFGSQGLVDTKLNYVPNVEWVLDQIDFTLKQSLPPRIEEGTFGDAKTFIETQDDTVSSPSGSKVIIGIDNIVTTTFNETTARMFDVSIEGNTVRSSIQDQNLVLIGSRYGNVEVDDSLVITPTSQHLDGLAGPSSAIIDPVLPPNGVKIYVKPEYTGGTGIYFVTDENTRDELISKNKAILYSMIF